VRIAQPGPELSHRLRPAEVEQRAPDVEQDRPDIRKIRHVAILIPRQALARTTHLPKQ
jgi:hypothetical protein